MPSSNSDARKRHEAAGRIIGLSGWAQSGKDSMANVLVELGFEKLAFADPLRELARLINPLVESAPHRGEVLQANDLLDDPRRGYEWAKANTSYRQFLQDLGIGVRDILGQKVWVDAALARLQPGVNYVISDVRFPNEADAIREMGGEVWRMQRNGLTPPNDHPSERALDSYVPTRYISVPDYKSNDVKLRLAMWSAAKAALWRPVSK